MNSISDVRPSPIAGTWYSADPQRLRQQVDQYLHPAEPPEVSGRVVAVIAPHAGHRYSGRTAGYAFAPLVGAQRDLVAVLSPMHSAYPASLITSAHQSYATPLGVVPIDSDALAQLEDGLLQEGLSMAHLPNDSEHSLEIELPFLQQALVPGFQLLPVMVRTMSPGVARRLGHTLARVLKGRNCLLVASTDLSHFYPEDMARELDLEMLRRMRSFTPDDLFQAEQTGKGFACGVAAVAAVLWAAQDLGADRVEILHHSTSADETGDRGSVVGYGAAVVLKTHTP